MDNYDGSYFAHCYQGILNGHVGPLFLNRPKSRGKWTFKKAFLKLGGTWTQACLKIRGRCHGTGFL